MVSQLYCGSPLRETAVIWSQPYRHCTVICYKNFLEFFENLSILFQNLCNFHKFTQNFWINFSFVPWHTPFRELQKIFAVIQEGLGRGGGELYWKDFREIIFQNMTKFRDIFEEMWMSFGKSAQVLRNIGIR